MHDVIWHQQQQQQHFVPVNREWSVFGVRWYDDAAHDQSWPKLIGKRWGNSAQTPSGWDNKSGLQSKRGQNSPKWYTTWSIVATWRREGRGTVLTARKKKFIRSIYISIFIYLKRDVCVPARPRTCLAAGIGQLGASHRRVLALLWLVNNIMIATLNSKCFSPYTQHIRSHSVGDRTKYKKSDGYNL